MPLAEQQFPEPDGADQRLAGLTLLCLEDEALLAMLLEDSLVDQGCTCLMAHDVATAMAIVERGGFDVAVLDVNVGGELSFPVAQALLARGIPLLFTTGYGSADMPAEMQGCAMLPKPYDPERLVAALALTISPGISASGKG